MGIVQTAILRLVAPTLSVLNERLTAVEGRLDTGLVLSADDRQTIMDARAIVAEIRAASNGEAEPVVMQPAAGGGIVLPEIRQ